MPTMIFLIKKLGDCVKSTTNLKVGWMKCTVWISEK